MSAAPSPARQMRLELAVGGGRGERSAGDIYRLDERAALLLPVCENDGIAVVASLVVRPGPLDQLPGGPHRDGSLAFVCHCVGKTCKQGEGSR